MIFIFDKRNVAVISIFEAQMPAIIGETRTNLAYMIRNELIAEIRNELDAEIYHSSLG